MKTAVLSPKEATFVKAKLEGKSNTQAAAAAVPGLKPNSLPVVGLRLSRSVNVQVELQRELTKQLKKHDITIKRVMSVISDALNATKVVVNGRGEDAFAEVEPDHTTRLKAATMASDMLGLKNKAQPTQNPFAKGFTPVEPNDTLDNEELVAALQNSDEVRLQQVVFKNNQNTA